MTNSIFGKMNFPMWDFTLSNYSAQDEHNNQCKCELKLYYTGMQSYNSQYMRSLNDPRNTEFRSLALRETTPSFHSKCTQQNSMFCSMKMQNDNLHLFSVVFCAILVYMYIWPGHTPAAKKRKWKKAIKTTEVKLIIPIKQRTYFQLCAFYFASCSGGKYLQIRFCVHSF